MLGIGATGEEWRNGGILLYEILFFLLVVVLASYKVVIMEFPVLLIKSLPRIRHVNLVKSALAKGL